MRISVTDIIDELGIEKMTSAEEIKNIPEEKIRAVLVKIAARMKAAQELGLLPKEEKK